MAHGGKRGGSGRSPKWAEEENMQLLKDALKKLYKTDDDRMAIIKLIEENVGTDAGKLWVLRRLMGDPKKAVELSSSSEQPLQITVSYESKPDDTNIPTASTPE